MRIFTALLTLLILTACGSNQGGSAASAGSVPDTRISVAPAPSPSPSPSASSSPSPRPLNRVWSTATVPNNSTLGVYTGPPTNGPVYKLDLTWAVTGVSLATFEAKINQFCFYDVSLGTASYRINSFQGCNPGVIPPGGTVNDQCSYCPYNGPSSVQLNITYDYVLSGQILIIHDTLTGQTVTYY